MYNVRALLFKLKLYNLYICLVIGAEINAFGPLMHAAVSEWVFVELDNGLFNIRQTLISAYYTPIQRSWGGGGGFSGVTLSCHTAMIAHLMALVWGLRETSVCGSSLTITDDRLY